MTGMIRIVNAGSIGSVIGQLRAMTRLSQRALVAESGGAFSHPQLSCWENDKTMPSLPGLLALARALGYDLALVPKEDA